MKRNLKKLHALNNKLNKKLYKWKADEGKGCFCMWKSFCAILFSYSLLVKKNFFLFYSRETCTPCSSLFFFFPFITVLRSRWCVKIFIVVFERITHCSFLFLLIIFYYFFFFNISIIKIYDWLKIILLIIVNLKTQLMMKNLIPKKKKKQDV